MQRASRHFRYDADGNIILIREERESPASPKEEKMERNACHGEEKAFQRISALWSSMRGNVKTTIHGVAAESVEQCRASVHSGRSLLRDMLHEMRLLADHTKKLMQQPVWVPSRNQKFRKTSRGWLFFSDTVRFGATFAGIFVVLFVGLNYQSFTEIVASKIAPLSPSVASSGSSETEMLLRDKLQKVPALNMAGRSQRNLLLYLPEVGPVKNMLIIPKLNLKVPIVDPSYAAMLKEDWVQVEKDIQGALELGVVHYPGTAHPGQAGNFFITGHSSYYPWAQGKYKTIFARLHQLNAGDEYWVYYRGDKHRYVVREKREVSPSDTSVLDQPRDMRIATMMTCTPIGTALRRLILVAQEVDPLTGTALKVGEHMKVALPDVRVPEMLPI